MDYDFVNDSGNECDHVYNHDSDHGYDIECRGHYSHMCKTGFGRGKPGVSIIFVKPDLRLKSTPV